MHIHIGIHVIGSNYIYLSPNKRNSLSRPACWPAASLLPPSTEDNWTSRPWHHACCTAGNGTCRTDHGSGGHPCRSRRARRPQMQKPLRMSRPPQHVQWLPNQWFVRNKIGYWFIGASSWVRVVAIDVQLPQRFLLAIDSSLSWDVYPINLVNLSLACVVMKDSVRNVKNIAKLSVLLVETDRHVVHSYIYKLMK